MLTDVKFLPGQESDAEIEVRPCWTTWTLIRNGGIGMRLCNLRFVIFAAMMSAVLAAVAFAARSDL